MRLNTEQIEALDNRYRALFINALSGFKSANLIATCDDRKITNLAIFSSVFHIGSMPPLLPLLAPFPLLAELLPVEPLEAPAPAEPPSSSKTARP